MALRVLRDQWVAETGTHTRCNFPASFFSGRAFLPENSPRLTIARYSMWSVPHTDVFSPSSMGSWVGSIFYPISTALVDILGQLHWPMHAPRSPGGLGCTVTSPDGSSSLQGEPHLFSQPTQGPVHLRPGYGYSSPSPALNSRTPTQSSSWLRSHLSVA